MTALGETLAVFRGADSGKVFVKGAFCPHLGANIAAFTQTRKNTQQNKRKRREKKVKHEIDTQKRQFY